MNKALTVLLAITLAVTFLTACQATPEKTVVIQKCINVQDGSTVMFDEDYHPLIFINAIDGSVIDTQKGY